MAKMIGKTHTGKNVTCACCVPTSWRATIKRNTKRSERNAIKKEIRNEA